MNTKIAGSNTVNHWIGLRNEVDANPGNADIWNKIFDNIFFKRVETRYLKPMKVLENNIHEYSGEGFSIVAIQCSLIEFLETTITGETYVRNRPNRANYEYNRSGDKFESFLKNRYPFKHKFDQTKVHDFYVSVRCGILHEAQTKDNWVIRVDNQKDVVETNHKGQIVFDRVKFNGLLKIFFKKYKEDLISDTNLQSALRRKINVICRLPIQD